MDQSTGLLLGVCGLSIACAGVLAFLAVAFFRLGGRSLSALLPGRGEGTSTGVRLPRRRRIDLRAKAQAVDFDSALRAQSGQDAGALPPNEGTLPPSRFDLSTPRRNLRSRDRQRSRDEDEIFGGMLDIDGDGEPDF